MWKYTLICLDFREDAPSLEQDFSWLRNRTGSNPPQAAYDKIAQGDLELTRLETGDFHIDNFSLFWEGYRDTETREWDDTRALYSYWAMVPDGHWAGPIHEMSLGVVNHDLLIDTTTVLTWPTDIEADETPAGYPPGYSVTEWLRGTVADGSPFDGVLPFHFPLGNMDFGGIEAVWDTIIFDAAHMPNMPTTTSADLYGYFGFMGLRDLLDELARVARGVALDAGLDLHPAYGMRTIRDPSDATKLCPQFYWVDEKQDGSGTDTPVAYYSITPDMTAVPPIWPVEYPLHHSRDGHSSRTEVVVMADGDHAYGLFWAAKHSDEGAARYPAPYHRRGYWGGPPVLNSNLSTQDECDVLAQRVVDVIWGARGTLTWRAHGPRNLRPADLVELHYPPEGQNHHLLRVIRIDLEESDSGELMVITAGERAITIGDIQLPRAQTPMLATSGQTTGGALSSQAAGQFAGGAGVNGTPRQRPVVNVPSHSKQNIIKPQFNDVTALRAQATTATRPASGDDPAPPAVPLAQAEDTTGVRREWWSGADGTGHPHHYETYLPDGTDPAARFVIVDDSCELRSAACLNLDGTINTDLTQGWVKNGVTVSAPTNTSPLVCGWRDVVVVLFTGTWPADGVLFLMSERRDDL